MSGNQAVMEVVVCSAPLSHDEQIVMGNDNGKTHHKTCE